MRFARIVNVRSRQGHLGGRHCGVERGKLLRVGGGGGGGPFVGDPLAAALRRSGAGTGGELSDLGRRGEERILRLARVLGAVVVALPTLLLLYFALPPRIRQMRQLSAAAVLLQGADDPERRRLLAMRAAFSLPYATLRYRGAEWRS